MPMPPPPPPGPPPQGPPPPMPPPPSAFNSSKSKGSSGGDNRGALLQSIRQGAKLKKTVTVDKSTPLIAGKSLTSSANNSNLGRAQAAPSVSANSNSQPVSNGIGLGGLFAGGIPKLRPTGLRTGISQPALNTVGTEPTLRPSPDPPRQNTITNAASTSQLNQVLRRQLSSDIRNRGPPPQPPAFRNNNNISDVPDSSLRLNRTSPDTSLPLPIANKSSLHRSSGNSYEQYHHNNGGYNGAPPTPSSAPTPIRPIISHGKPNLAPKPPPQGPQGLPAKPATPPKKPMMNGRVPVSRAQSMKVPRSPPVAPPMNPPFPPATINGKDFGTIRGVPSAFHQSQENLSSVITNRSHTRNQTLPVNLIKNVAPQPPSGRPSGPPPSRPPVPPPPSRTASNVNLKAPLSPPPPPPGPLPPYRTSPAPPSHTRPPPAVPSNGPPPPPVRNSSMRNGPLDFDTRFSNLFHPVNDFPKPCRFDNCSKVYSNKNAANKQQAPLPPNAVHLGGKLWDSSTC